MSMTDGFLRRAIGASLALAFATSAGAESVSVSPTSLLVPPGGRQTTMTVRAEGAGRSTLQVRVYGWDERTPANQLHETRDVVVSPPITELGARQELTVRIVRAARSPVRGRECYRVLVDRLPDGAPSQQLIALRIRHSVPLCFVS